MFNNSRIEVTRYGLHSPKVKGEVKIAHLSDLHEKEFGQGNGRLFKKVDLLKPDIIAVTGDIVAHENQKAACGDYAVNLARGLAAIAPSFFVTGNHERQFDHEICGAFAQSGVTVVKGGVYTMDIRGSRVNVSGIDDVSYGGVDIEKAFHVFEDMEGFNVFLTHRPEFFEMGLRRNIDLILAGHTHAGQIRFPKFGSFFMMGQGWFPRYMQGQFSDGETTMIISRGLGSSGYPTFRINNPPDLVLIDVAEGAPPEKQIKARRKRKSQK